MIRGESERLTSYASSKARVFSTAASRKPRVYNRAYMETDPLDKSWSPYTSIFQEKSLSCVHLAGNVSIFVADLLRIWQKVGSSPRGCELMNPAISPDIRPLILCMGCEVWVVSVWTSGLGIVLGSFLLCGQSGHAFVSDFCVCG